MYIFSLSVANKRELLNVVLLIMGMLHFLSDRRVVFHYKNSMNIRMFIKKFFIVVDGLDKYYH